MVTTTSRPGPLPPAEQVPVPRTVWQGQRPPIELDRAVAGADQGFAHWASQQYAQVIAPITEVLDGSSRSSLAERAGLGRGAVASALEGTAWPQTQTVVRLAYLAGVELFGLAGRDLVAQGPRLPADEQAVLFAYRRLPVPERRRMLQEALARAAEELRRP